MPLTEAEMKPLGIKVENVRALPAGICNLIYPVTFFAIMAPPNIMWYGRNIEKTIENRHLEEEILEVRVPMQDVVEMKNGARKTVFPCAEYASCRICSTSSSPFCQDVSSYPWSYC